MLKEEPIRILIIGMHDKIGGIETFLMNYYRNLDKEKVQFDFISIYDKLCFEDEIEKLGGKVYKICSEKRNPIKYIKELSKIIKVNNYKIVHINMLSAANILPVIVAKKQKVKHIIIHSHNSNTPSGILRKLLNLINKPFLHMGTDFFACSKLAGEWLFGKKFLKKHKLTIINNAINIDKYRYNAITREKIRKELNVEDKFIIGHIGRFCYQKNHDFLINVFYEVQKRDKTAVLLLIGEGELEDSIKEKVKRLGIANKVIFLGTTDKVEDYLQAMDVFVLPSRFEGLPVVGIEAQASGTRCIFSKNITSEVNLTNNVKFIGLDEKIEEWAEEIINKNQTIKNNTKISKLIENYDAKKMSKELTNRYLQMEKTNIMHTLYGLGNGGVETLLYNYFSEIDKYNLSIVTQECSSEDVRKKFESIGFTIYEVPKKKHIIKYICAMTKIIKEEKPDIIHSHMTMGNFLPNAIAFLKKVPVRISHSHFAYASKNIKNNIYSKLGKVFSNEYVACTKDAAKYLFGKGENKAYILKNAINLDKFKYIKENREKIREELHISERYVIGNVGRFTKQKNHEFLIDIFYEIHKNDENAILLLVGDGELESKIKNKIEELKLEKHVIILSNRDDINELMMAMDVFIFPTLFEGLGIVLIEAQATGLKCISSDNVPKDVILTNKITLLQLKERESWINNYIDCKHSSDDRSVNLKVFRENGYDINIERNKLVDYYEETLRGRKH